MLCDYVLYKFTIDIDIDIDIMRQLMEIKYVVWTLEQQTNCDGSTWGDKASEVEPAEVYYYLTQYGAHSVKRYLCFQIMHIHSYSVWCLLMQSIVAHFCLMFLLWPPYVIEQATYIFILWFLLLLSFFSHLISAVRDWMSTILPHMVWP